MNLTDHMKLIDKSQMVVEMNTNNNNNIVFFVIMVNLKYISHIYMYM